jgi:tRNA pseudouridine38-40 synthase
VQAVIETALAQLVGQPVSCRGAGRTDAGVHARGQVISVRLATRITAEKMVFALQSKLPPEISVQSAERLPEDWGSFSAKHHSVGKRYVYRVHNDRVHDPFSHTTSWSVREPLDVMAMRTAAHQLVGEHDFEAFRTIHCDAPHARRCLWRVAVEAGKPITIEVRGNAFCRNMVRIIAGTLVDVGRGRIATDAMPAILASRDRTRAGITAPAHGLTLEEVYYPDTIDRAEVPIGVRFPGYPISGHAWPPGAWTQQPDKLLVDVEIGKMAHDKDG